MAVLGHPLGTLKVGVECPAGAVGFATGIKVQDCAGDFAPVGVIGIKQAHIGDEVFVVVGRQGLTRRRDIGDIWIERRSLNGRSRNRALIRPFCLRLLAD